MNEDNHDEYQKGRGQNKEEYPDNIEAAGFSLQRGMYQNVVELDIVDVNLIAVFLKGHLHPLMEEEAQHFVRCISCNLECY